MRLRQTRIGVFCLLALLAVPLAAGEVAKADLDILGLGLEVDRNPVVTAVDVPPYVQTLFGGKTGDEAPPANGLSALGELTGPGITTPITLATTPGRAFAIPALHAKGDYQLQNIRLVGADGAFLQQAVPSFAIINVSDVLETHVRVRQLTPDELRQRGIVVDARNYDVYEYTFIFGVDQTTVEIPYPVIIDRRTHEVTPLPRESQYTIPPVPVNARPPRFEPPSVATFELDGGPPDGGDGLDHEGRPGRPSIPAALVVPTGFGVLHQFFAVVLQVDNGAPAGSNIRLDSVTATIGTPTQLRVSKVVPAVSLGQPVPIVDESTGASFLVAAGRGSAEWTLEALKAGTHSVNVEVNATYQQPGQPDFPLRGHVSTTLVVSDPRFQINFSHPDTVRKDERYTAYAFVTNLSANFQHVLLDLSQIPACTSGAAAENICREEGTAPTAELDLQPGEMKPVPYKLNSKITGKVFAAAGVANDETVGASVKLTMGVSATGIPLSPATLVLPYYARYLPSDFVDANMQLLGLGYSLATAPLTQATAKFPRVLKTDVFTRAQQIARAGQRIFVARRDLSASDPLENREPFFQLALDLLGNAERVDQANTAPELREWDDLRRAEESGRRAEAAMARQLETQAFSNGETPQQFVSEFAAATSHRTGFLFAYAHGANVDGAARPYAVSVTALATGTRADVPAEAAEGWIRTLPYAQLTRLNAGGDVGELALVGRWPNETLRVSVVPAAASFTLHLIYPDANDGVQLRTDLAITGATPGVAVDVDVVRGSHALVVKNAVGVATVNVVPQTPLRVIGAAQDLHLDDRGHIVSLLFNRPVRISDAATLRDQFALTVDVPKANYHVTRKNVPSDPNAQLQIPGAALQDDAKIINVTFDKALSRNAQYLLAVDAIHDISAPAVTFAVSDVVPRIDNDRPGAILTGLVLRGDNSVIPNVLVRMTGETGGEQIDVTGADGRFLYEFVPRDADSGIYGGYALSAEAEGKSAKLEGAVRLPGEVHTVNLQFLGRGRARGQVRYSDGEVVADVDVTIGSTMFDQVRHGRTDAAGNYDIGDLPVGPLTFSVFDNDGRPTFAANQIRVAGEVVTQDLVIVKRDAPGLGSVRVIVRRSDTNAPVAGALVGVWAQGYALRDGSTDADGTFLFSGIPAGVVSVLAADFGISRNGAGVEVELRPDQTLEQTLVLSVPAPNVETATLEGVVIRDDPAAPGDASKDAPAAGAIVTIDRVSPVTTNPDGSYTIADLPLSAAERRISVFDPATGRRGYFSVPTLVAGSNHFNMKLRSTEPAGTATMRIRLYGPQGEPVTGYRVIWPGFPATSFTPRGDGVYELPDMRVPQQVDVVAVPSGGNSPYGDQAASGNVRVDFGGQVGVTDLHLPGSGTIVVRTEIEQPCSTPPCYAQVLGPIAMSYSVWDEAEQGFRPKTFEGTPDSETGLVTFHNVPARQNVGLSTVRNPAGFAAGQAYLAYDGDVRNVTLRLSTIGDVTGRVYAHDGVTPVSGATVRLYTDRATYAPAITNPDGTFRFAAVAAGTPFTIVADLERDGVYRTGIVGGATPGGGGPVSNLVIVMRTQSTVEGQVLDQNGVKVPLARYWLRELAWPYRAIGTPQDPLQADINGRFVVSNVFTGDFRITAVDPTNQELRGDYQGHLSDEGDATQRSVQVRIGGAGTGAVSVTVTDPLLGFAKVANAEVALLRGSGRFDFTSTNDNGVAFFDGVPVGRYTIVAYSKSAGRAGHAVDFDVAAGSTVPVTVQLEFRGLVSGTLTDPESEPTPGLPSKGMPVQLQATGSSAAASTDVDGAFVFNGVPEGPFSLIAYEIGSLRRAVGPSGLFISTLVPEQKNIHLELERTATLTVRVHLPLDNGAAGDLAPLAEVTVWQGDLIWGPVPYYRGQQGNPTIFRKMLASSGYGFEVRELGGEGRVVKGGGGFGGALEKTEDVVLPTSGTVEVHVLDGSGNPVEDAKVDLFAPGIGNRTMFTPSTGSVTLPGVPFGWITASASKGNVTASGGGSLVSRSQPLQLTLNLGSNASVEGGVDAEIGNGTPSAGTRVLLLVTSRLSQPLRLETLTDANGAYRFTGIPVGGTTLAFTFYGPDDTTIGATRTVPVADGTTGTIVVPRVRIDATPPRVLSIDPPANATSVSPSTPITITFSEQLAAAYLNGSWFQLLATDDSSLVACTVEPSVRPDGTFIVKLVPPPPGAGQKFPLKSNVLYRLAIPAGIQDTTGNPMLTAVGSSFTTVNYTEPAVLKVDPAETEPIPASATFRVKFNKAIAANSFEIGGVVRLENLDAYKGNAVEVLPISAFPDPADATTFVIAPRGVAIAESSFYRLTVSGARDTQTPPNVQKDDRVFEFFSFDTKKPIARITSSDDNLVSELLYTASVRVTDDGTDDESNDIAYVDWLDANGTAIARVRTKPFAYSFAAPAATTTGSTFTLQAVATDLSGNSSPAPDVHTWNVLPNDPPRDILVTNTPDAAYPTHAVHTTVAFHDEGLKVTLALELRGTATNGDALHQIVGSQNITRPSTAVPFPDASFDWTLPATLKDGAATLVVTATDSVNKSGIAEVPLTVLADTTKPEIVAFTPKAETHYQYNTASGSYTIELQVRDAETGIARATISVGGVAQSGVTSSFDSATGITTFRKSVTVPPRNADTRVPVAVSVYDQRDNVTTDTHEVIYDRVDDATIPTAAWITPLDGAALPANQSDWLTTLRVRATDDVKVTSVRFESTALAAPVDATLRAGTSDVFEARVAFTFPADRTPFTVKAIVDDADPSHSVELPITIDPVDVDRVISANINISSITADQYANRSVLVRGVRVYVSVPLALKDLVLVDGAVLSNPEETKLDLTIADHLFVDADSRVDLTGRGYLGGLHGREDRTPGNASRLGRTRSGNGAANADASYGGIGGSYVGTTNATYGSITDPVDFGSGGGAQPSGGDRPGSNGGGAVLLRGGSGLARFVLAGPVLADGEPPSGSTFWMLGSGGTISLRAHALITGPWTRISANGADGGAENNLDRGAGGGRIELRASDRFEVALSAIQARGGRHTGADNEAHVDGGAGTIYLVRPGATLGELVVSSFDDRVPATAHRTAATPIGGGAFDSITIGPRVLARFDSEPSGTLTVDPSASIVRPNDPFALTLVSSDPAAGSSVAQNTTITVHVTAESASGIRQLRATLGVQPVDVFAYPNFVSPLGDTTLTIAIPNDAPLGATTLKLYATDRAGRVAESAPLAFNIIHNAAPVIDAFDVSATETYANHNIDVSAAASDDVAVTSLALASSQGSVTSGTATRPTPQTMTRTFSVAIPSSAPSGSDVTLTLSALDDVPGRIATTQTKTVHILKDTLAPSLAVATPQPNAQLQEGTGATFVVEATSSDAEVAVQRVTVTFDGVTSDLTYAGGDVYRRTLNVPSVDGSEPIAKTLTVTSIDYDGNTESRTLTVYIKPLVDPNAAALAWVCASPNASYPLGYEFPLRVTATPSSPSNGVERVEFSINGATPVLASRIGGSDQYEIRYTIPGGTANDTSFDVRVTATSAGGNQAVLLGSFTAVANAIDVSTRSVVTPLDAGYQNRDVVVRAGGDLVLSGEQHLRNLIVLDGGKVEQQQVADGTPLPVVSVQRLFVACGGAIDVSAQGYPGVTAYPGSATPTDSSGGGHIGRGGEWSPPGGGTYGSIEHPAEKGGGGHTIDPNYATTGGGVLRLDVETFVTVDGAIRANGIDNDTWGPGAGGSVYLTTRGRLAGGGSIEARGGGDNNNRGGGGGGAIAIEYGSLGGTIADHLVARGGRTNSGRPGAAGSVFIRANGAALGDLVIDNAGFGTGVETDLPWLGAHTIASVSNGTATLANRAYIQPFQVGNWARVVAPDGTIRGTYRIASIENDPQAATPSASFWFGNDQIAYDGYLVYRPGGFVEGRKIAMTKFENGQWSYDNDDGRPFVPFTPDASDRVFASFRKNSPHIYDVRRLTCGTTCGSIGGIAVAELVGGSVYANAYGGIYSGNVVRYVDTEFSEFLFAFDTDWRNVTLVRTAPRITLASTDGSPVVMQPGDQLRGVYRFNHVTVRGGAHVLSRDTIESANAPAVAADSSLVTNASGPAIDASKVTIEQGRTGPVLAGAAGAVRDAEGVDVFARNTARPALPATAELLQNASFIELAPNRGGLRLQKIPNFNQAPGTIETPEVGDSAYLTFNDRSPNNLAFIGVANHYFHFPTGNRWEVWPNGAWANSGFTQGTLDASTRFRLEKTPDSVQWYVNDALVYELKTVVPPSAKFTFGFRDDWMYFDNVEFYSTAYGTRTRPSAADGSFRVPFDGAAGDAVTIAARDRNVFRLTTGEISIGAIPANLGVASVTFPGEVTGGGSTTGTVTLRAPAGSEGVLVLLSTTSSAVAIPSSVVIPSGATTATFNVATTPVANAVSAPIAATWGGVSVTGTLQIVKDHTAPSIAVTSPVPNAAFTEGQSAPIVVTATVTDTDSGVKRVFATLDGNTYELAHGSGDTYSAQLPVPFVDGTQDVTRDLVVSAEDNNGNSGSANAIPLVIHPVVDANAPSLAWQCAGSDALFPAGYAAKLRVVAKAPTPANVIRKVELTVSGTTVQAAPLGNDVWEATFTVPDLADGTQLPTHVVATTASGTTASVDGSFTVMKGAVEIRSSGTITAADSAYEHRSIAVFDGVTLTIAGAHTFDRVALLGNAVLAPMQEQPLAISVSTLYVACGASIDATAKGYTNRGSYPGVPGVNGDEGGGHIGRGGGEADDHRTYGSVDRPQEFGSGGTDTGGGWGGGAIRVNATNVVVDGAIRANGATDAGSGLGSGGGGSVWITTARIAGGGSIEADGGSGACSTGGGGAIAIEYSDPSSVVPAAYARPGAFAGCTRAAGGAGSVFIKRSGATFGDVTFDAKGRANDRVELEGIGSGLALAGSTGATLVTDRATDVPAYFAGHWIRITAPDGTVKGTWRITAISARTLTLAPNGSESINIVAGDQWQGLYRFDTVTARDVTIVSWDPIEATTYDVFGTVAATRVSATGVVVHAQSTLTHPTGGSLTIDAANEVRVDAGGAIDTTARGYTLRGSYPGVAGVGGEEGASHIGRGGKVASLKTYGSIDRPSEAGGAGTDTGIASGGGVVRIRAARVTVHGAIRANGANTGQSTLGAGAGGSVWITAGSVTGSGSIETIGGDGCASGGGGAIAIETTDSASALPALLARAGHTGGACVTAAGAPGSILLHRAQSTYGELTIDAAGVATSAITDLPSLGNGVAQNGSNGATLVTDFNVLPFFAGHWVEIANANGVKGVWRIAATNGNILTLAPNAGESMDIQPGDAWYGVQRFDTVRLFGARLQSADRVDTASLSEDGASSHLYNSGAPQFPAAKRAQIAVTSTSNGDAIVALAGAVVDPDTPIHVVATNLRTGQATTPVDAAADGSFTIPLVARAGDTFTVRATDTHAFPLASPSIPVAGTIVEQNGLGALGIAPANVVAGTSATGTVQLLQPARSAGVVVALASSSGAATVPPTITIAGGATSAQFTIATPSSPNAANVTITATLGTTTKTATLHVLATGTYTTTVTGRVLDERAHAVANAAVTCDTTSVATDASGFFSIANMPATGAITCNATLTLADGTTLSGASAATTPVADGITNVGDLVLHSSVVVTQLSQSSWGVDGSFRARNVVRDGTTLLVSGAGGGAGNGDSDRIALLDVSDPDHPAFVRSLSAGNTAIYDVAAVDGWAYIASYDFCTVNYANPSATKNCYGSIGALSLALVNRYMYVATNSDYRLRVYDVADPANARLIREQAMVPGSGFGSFFWRLIDLGNGYLAGLSYSGHDLMIFDVRDVNNIVTVADLDLPDFRTSRGRLNGKTLYLTNAYQTAAVDVSDPAHPVVLSRAIHTDDGSEGIAIVGTEAFPAAGSYGLAQYDITSPAAPFFERTIPFGGTARDVLFYANHAYVANDLGIAYAKLPVAPQVSAVDLTLTRGASDTAVHGRATAVSGAAPLTVTVTNRTTGATATGFAVRADGSFDASIAASSGDAIDVTAYDVVGRASITTNAGFVPFGASMTDFPFGGGTYRARTVRTDGHWLAVAKWADEGISGSNNELAVFDISNPAAPVYKWTLAAAEGSSYGLAVRDGWAYVGSYDFCTIDLTSSTSTRHCVGLDAGDLGVAVAGNYAFTSVNFGHNDGRIRVYDVSNPASPHLVHEQDTTPGTQLESLLAFGDDYLVATQAPSHDVIVIDHRDVNNLVKLADVDIPNFSAFRGAISGDTLYLAGYGDKIAVVDLSNPASPVVKSVFSNGAMTQGVAVSGNRAVFGGLMLGALFYDITDPNAPRYLGRQQTSGNAFDVALVNGVLYVANEQGLVTIPEGVAFTGNSGAPQFPQSKRAQIVVTSDAGGDFVTGPAGAVIDPDTPIHLAAKNVRTGAIYSGPAASDGSFRISVGGQGGDAFTLTATDSHVAPLSSTVAVNGAIVDANQLSTLTIEPSSVNAGESTFGTVRLATPARSSGIVVTLTSSASSVTLPPSITIAAGQTTAQFSIATAASTSNVTATITARYQQTKIAALNVAGTNGALASLALDANAVEGGASVNATVTLGSAAPAGGALVSLAASTTQLHVPPAVLVPAGTSQVTFTVTTDRVGAATTASVFATYGASKSASLTLNACATLASVARPSSTPLATMWIDDAPPSGANASGDATFDATQVAAGSLALHFAAGSGARSWTFANAAPMSVQPDDNLVLYALVNPCDPPRQILATWSDGTTQWRASWGESRLTPAATQVQLAALPAGGVWTRLEVLASSLGITSATNVNSLTISVDGGEAWFDAIGDAACVLGKAAKPSYLPGETVWFDDALPAGGVERTPFDWSSAQAASGTLSMNVPNGGGSHQSHFDSASATMTLGMDDVIVVYALIDPCAPPRELMLEFNDGGWSRRVYWGDDLVAYGTDGTVERRRMGSMPKAGEWVRLEIPVSSMQMAGMSLRGMSFVIYDGQAWFDRVAKVTRVNLAYHKPTSMSSWLSVNGREAAAPSPCPYNCAEYPVDGDMYSYAHTGNAPQEWWQVDLGAVQPIDAIDVWNGGFNMCCQERLSRFWVHVSDTPFTSGDLNATLAQSGVTSYFYYPNAQRPSTFDVRRTGRYVRVQLSGQEYLHPAEVQVWAPVSPQRVNLSAGRKATQSSTYQDYGPWLAVNANTNGVLGSEYSINHTTANLEEWWSVDLCSVQAIDSIDVWGRLDWPPHFLTNFYIFVSDEPIAGSTTAEALADPKVAAYYYGTPVLIGGKTFPIGRTGRYVRVQMTASSQFAINLAEVQVWSSLQTLRALATPSAPKAAALSSSSSSSSSTSTQSRFDFANAYRRNAHGRAAGLR